MTNYLYLDFGANRNTTRNKTIFSNNLEDQFSNMLQFEGEDFEDFIREHFINDNEAVYFSNPNFNGQSSKDEKYNLVYYNNIAIRFPKRGERNDLVIMGDIMEKENGHRIFIVKAILTMDSEIVHYGELKRICSTVIRLTKGGNWETATWDAPKPDWDHINHSTLTNDFMLNLGRQTVVPDPEKVLGELKAWRQYLESREYLIQTDEKNGYDLGYCKPEIFIAYTTKGKHNTEEYGRIKYLKDREGSTWTLKKVNEDSRECILMHIYVDVFEKDYVPNIKSRTNQKKKFDYFTRYPLILIDPDARQDKSNSPGLSIREKRIETSMLETVEPTDMLIAIEQEREQLINKFKKDQEQKFLNDLTEGLSTYKNAILPQIANEYVSEQTEAVHNRIIRENESNIQRETIRINGLRKTYEKEITEITQKIVPKQNEFDSKNILLSQKKKLLSQISENGKGKQAKETKKLHKEIDKLIKPLRSLESEIKNLQTKLEKNKTSLDMLDNEEKALHQKYDPYPLIEKELERLKNDFCKQAISEEEVRLREDLRSKYDVILSSGIVDINNDINTRKEKTKEDNNISRFHVYFELDIPENESISENLKTFQKYVKPGLSLRKDYLGDKILLKRQTEALDNLLNGYVLNPFLATFLFSPSSKGKSALSHIDHFFSNTLNDSQKEAVEKALSSNGLFLIQGPPGTGKTQVIAEITAQLAASGRKVLIASQNNKAVDNAFSRIPKVPMIRPMRILSENASKQNNAYAQSELLSNFYNNLSESMKHEVSIFQDRQKYELKLEDYLKELTALLEDISELEKATENINVKIRETESELKAEYTEKDRIENSNYLIEEEQEKKSNEITDITEFNDDKFLKKLLRDFNEKGLQIEDYGEPACVLKAMYQTPYDEIVSEFVKRIEHEEYFELKHKKSETTSASEISKLNKELKEYCEDNDFSEKDAFPLFSAFDTIPSDKTVFLECKQHLDSTVDKKISSLKNAMETYAESKQDLSRINNEITRLKTRIEDLKKDSTYQKLVDAENKFDVKAKEIFVNLRINTIWKNRKEAIVELNREKRRIAEEFKENHQEIEERAHAYNRMSKYISSEDVIKKDSIEYNPILLKTVNVIGMTCSAKSYFKDNNDNQIRLNELNIDVVIVDEVSKVPFIEILQPILYGKTVILVGDHKQLPPIFDTRLNDDEDNIYDPQYINHETEEKYKRMYENSFFAELFDNSPDSMKSPLNIQYRMHPDIMEVDNVFYNGELKFGGNVTDKEHYLEIDGGSGKRIIRPSNHVIFINVEGHEVKESGSTSYTNPEEIRTVRKLLDLINKNCRKDRNGNKLNTEYRKNNDTRLSVGVICPYSDQAREIRKNKGDYRSFNHDTDEKFMVKSVDDFQGDERDIIILSMVRTRKSEFLREFRRINVAISRARRLLIIVGNRKTLESMNVTLDGISTPVYRNMIRAIERKNGVLEQNAITGDE